ncbi:hypothetical protein TIFTF001_009310 [Ficus carica]|uniref:Uncharacterized protein n=1 Tax=Ficus carica TaxID=3494 RepID=A0AA88AGP2_FICCA|nr:hypothetical protein TIFTF001_009310 [Ficus carica]
MDELNGTQTLVQTTQVMDLTEEEDAAAARTAKQLSTSGRGETSDEGSESSGSATPLDRAGGRPVYTMDYFTSAVTPEYLESLWEEFEIPSDVELVVPGPNDLAS